MLLNGQVKETLKTFQPIALNEMDCVELMNRTDTKYIFNSCFLPQLINESDPKLRVLEINGERCFNYKTTYYDTNDYLLFNNHLLGKYNRHKIRHRTYESTGVSFLEVKFKSSKNRTNKWRIPNEVNGHFDARAIDFLYGHTKMNADTLNPVITNHFTRITLVDTDEKIRITLDYNISFQTDHQRSIELPYLAIAEVKQEGNNNNCSFIKLLRKYGIRQANFSKYCMGSALLYNFPRMNALKPNFLELQRIKEQNGIPLNRF